MEEIIQNNERNEEILREITFKTLEKMFQVEYIAYKASNLCDILNKIKTNAKLNRESIQYIFSLDE